VAADRVVSTYLTHLPAVLQQGPFLGRFLLAFEAILSGNTPLPPGYTADPTQADGQTTRLMPEGLEALLGRVSTFFDPDLTRSDFLPWLAQWVAASLRDDWSEQTRRAFIGSIVPLYKLRGTRAGMEAILRICVGDVSVLEIDRTTTYPYVLPFTVGQEPTAVPGYDETVRAFHFQVVLRVAENDPDKLARLARQTRETVDREKPAHTTYSLLVEYPAMQITDTAVWQYQKDQSGNVQKDPSGQPLVTVSKGILVGYSSVLGSTTATTTAT
jgi:phage tail-like protein